MANWNVLLVDDHPLMRKGLAQLLSCEKEFNQINEAGHAQEAIDFLSLNQPDLIILDLNLRDISGLELLKHIRCTDPHTRVVILTVSDSPTDIYALMEAGANGYLLKDSEPDHLVMKLKEVMQGKQVYSQQVGEIKTQQAITPDPLSLLTEREKQILYYVAKGCRNKDIASALFISEATVKVHIKNVLKKLKLTSRVSATLFYLSHYSHVTNQQPNNE